MKAELYWIETAPLRLAVLPRPRGGEYLDDEIASLAEQGVDVLVSLLTATEIAELELGSEATACARCGVRYVTFPIEDRNVPERPERVATLVDELRAALEHGLGVAIHCRAGIGRSAMIAAAVLATAGIGVDDAFSMISSARGCSVPDTSRQRQWVESYTASR